MSAGTSPLRVTPTSTYRVQVRPGFGFDQVAGILDHLDALGVSHVYLSPVLQPAPASAHGYDVVDHTALSTEAGGRAAFDRLDAQLRRRGMSAVADVVPNHMAVPTPVRLNTALWSVLREGVRSPYAAWFDLGWPLDDADAQPAPPLDRRRGRPGVDQVLMPVLGDRIGQVIAAGDLLLDTAGAEPVLRYGRHEFPVRPGTAHLPLAELVDRQWYRLAWWRVADEELNYRRFFDVDTLAAIRVEDPQVFDATHRLLVELVGSGALTGLRIDHPDGLADPRGYLHRLAAATDGVWVVVEKILEGEEELPGDWPCAGTTGYDALLRVGGLFVDPAGSAPLAALLTELTGDTPDFGAVVDEAKRDIVEGGLYAEVDRLVDLLEGICHADLALRDHTRRHLRSTVVELLVAFDRYRAYVVPGEQAPPATVEAVEAAALRARTRLPDDALDPLDLVVDLVLGRPAGRGPLDAHDEAARRELVVRFQQTCGPVMAKGVEDTAFYRWHRLTALNEVGGDPARFGITPEEFHAYAVRMQRDWPAAMTTLSTHDTKRSEDVRARLATLAEQPLEWAEAVRGWLDAADRYRSQDRPDPAVTYLIWQTLVATWDGAPISAERLVTYLGKAIREAKRYTSWTDPDEGYEGAVAGYATAVLADPDLMASLATFCLALADAARVAVLGQKLVQLAMPGVPDVYQGCELVDLSLVDPDNRRDVDVEDRRARLARLDAGQKPQDLSDDKLLVTSRVLRLRRARPQWFVTAGCDYQPIATTTGNAVAFARGDQTGLGVVAIATRLPVALTRHGGWGGHTVSLPPGTWRDELTGHEWNGGSCRLADLLADLPVAVLVRPPG